MNNLLARYRDTFTKLSHNVSLLYQKGAIHIFVGHITAKFVAFFGSIFLVRILSKDEFGYLSYIENLYEYIYVFAGLGLAHAVLRYIIKGDSIGKELGVYNYVVKRSISINALIAVLSLFLFYLYPHPERFSESNRIMWIILISLPVQYLVETNHLTLRAIFKNKYYALSALLVGILLVSCKSLFAYIWGVKGALSARLGVYAIAGFVLTVLLRSKYFASHSATAVSKDEIKEINRFSFHYMISNGVWMLFILNDTFLLGRMLGDPGAVAEYIVAYVFPANLGLIATSIGVFIGPYFVRNEEDYDWVWYNYKRLMAFVLFIVLPIAILLIVLSEYIIYYVYGSQYLGVVDLMRILTLSATINAVFRYTTANLLSVMGKIKYNMIVSVCGVVLQIAVNLLLIPKYGIYGPAFTSMLVFSLMSLVLFVIFVRIYRET